MERFGSSLCPQCSSPKVKAWKDLSDEERMLVEKLPLSAEISSEERKKHRFCTRCWFEETGDSAELA